MPRDNQYSGKFDDNSTPEGRARKFGKRAKGAAELTNTLDRTMQFGQNLGTFVQKYNSWNMANELNDFNAGLSALQAETELELQARPGYDPLKPLEQSAYWEEKYDAYVADKLAGVRNDRTREFLEQNAQTYKDRQMLEFKRANFTNFVKATVAKSDQQLQAYANRGDFQSLSQQIDREVAADIRPPEVGIRLKEGYAKQIAIDDWRKTMKKNVDGGYQTLGDAIEQIENGELTWEVDGEERSLSDEEKKVLIAEAKGEDQEDYNLTKRKMHEESWKFGQEWEKVFSQTDWYAEYEKTKISPIKLMEDQIAAMGGEENEELHDTFVHYSRLFQQRLDQKSGASSGAVSKALQNRIDTEMWDVFKSDLPKREAHRRALLVADELQSKYEAVHGEGSFGAGIDTVHTWVNRMGADIRKSWDQIGATQVFDAVAAFQEDNPGYGALIDQSMYSIYDRNLDENGKLDVAAFSAEVNVMIDAESDKLSMNAIQAIGSEPFKLSNLLGRDAKSADPGEIAAKSYEAGYALTDPMLNSVGNVFQGNLSAYNLDEESGVRNLQEALLGDQTYPDPSGEPRRFAELQRATAMVVNGAAMEREFESLTSKDYGVMISRDGTPALFLETKEEDGVLRREVFVREVVGTPEFDKDNQMSAKSDLDWQWKTQTYRYNPDGTIASNTEWQADSDLKVFIGDEAYDQKMMEKYGSKKKFDEALAAAKTDFEAGTQQANEEAQAEADRLVAEAGFKTQAGLPKAPEGFWTNSSSGPGHEEYAAYKKGNMLGQDMFRTYWNRKTKVDQAVGVDQQQNANIMKKLDNETGNETAFLGLARVWYANNKFQNWLKQEDEQKYEQLKAHIETTFEASQEDAQ